MVRVDEGWSGLVGLVGVGPGWSGLVRVDEGWSGLMKVGQGWSVLVSVGRRTDRRTGKISLLSPLGVWTDGEDDYHNLEGQEKKGNLMEQNP